MLQRGMTDKYLILQVIYIDRLIRQTKTKSQITDSFPSCQKSIVDLVHRLNGIGILCNIAVTFAVLGIYACLVRCQCIIDPGDIAPYCAGRNPQLFCQGASCHKVIMAAKQV